MKIRDIETFFGEVDRRIRFPVEVILTGGAAGLIYGTERATFDIDFEVHITGKSHVAENWASLQQVLGEISTLTNITPQYAVDIDRWSAIPLPKKKSTLYKKFKFITVKILNPELWAIGKLTRYIASDIDDLRVVLKRQKTNQRKCVSLWGEALKRSSPSPAQITFPRQVERFLDAYAKVIWGKSANPKQLKELFLKQARLH